MGCHDQVVGPQRSIACLSGVTNPLVLSLAIPYNGWLFQHVSFPGYIIYF